MILSRIAKFQRDYALARILIPAGLFLIVFGCFFLNTATTRKGYPRTDAIVTRSELYEEEHYEGDTLQEATFRIFVKYTVDGREYEGEYGIRPELKPGTAVRIDYNPDNPKDISQPVGLWLPAGQILGGAAALIAGILSMVNTLKKNRKLKEQEEEWSHGN